MVNPAKVKGSNFEREVAEIIKTYGFKAGRQPTSGAYGTISDNQYYKGDVWSDIPFTIECKKHEKISIWKCWRQAEDQATLYKPPLLIFTRNYQKEPLCTLKFNDLMSLIQKVENKDEAVDDRNDYEVLNALESAKTFINKAVKNFKKNNF